MTRMILLSLAIGLFSFSCRADGGVLKADFRHRPPEMVVEGERFSGPIKDILEEAADRLGYRVEWRLAPFPRSLNDLKAGRIDIIPRTVRNDEREAYVNFLGPIGHQRKDIIFLVPKGKERAIRSYEDLGKVTIGVKLATAYFDRFDKDQGLKKESAADDHNLARMFIGGRFDAVAVLDRPAMESALASLQYGDFTYADYRFKQEIGNYYGMSKTSANADVFVRLDANLEEMVASGRVAEIYLKFGATPPEP